MTIDKNDPRMRALLDMQKDLDPKFNKEKYKLLGKKNASKVDLTHDDYVSYLLDDTGHHNNNSDLVEWSDQESDDYLD